MPSPVFNFLLSLCCEMAFVQSAEHLQLFTTCVQHEKGIYQNNLTMTADLHGTTKWTDTKDKALRSQLAQRQLLGRVHTVRLLRWAGKSRERISRQLILMTNNGHGSQWHGKTTIPPEVCVSCGREGIRFGIRFASDFCFHNCLRMILRCLLWL